jgi:hypothetical protein
MKAQINEPLTILVNGKKSSKVDLRTTKKLRFTSQKTS